ncbi:cell wall-binding repeat-containing protein [Corynebacterium sanguinis]|uniref:cell wall-binding repeat-containing protein n=1 Tax=Corynebacterium sanguinis TaxID=2594913 RepID=UPI00223B78C2|nr:cell wall-binding repeat-containing protein [Corynebacterium sanguinis]MCT1597920.1 cell wall-binding repeat-containing protein [Corynebacterium sanguinis]MCT1694126.1 cell wall-binding repeat-containing protein [Corynebacterium sanguinis]MCT1713674.1 cell wall-binding repeat-containing protein [Corynebacterium sanguinis]
MTTSFARPRFAFAAVLTTSALLAGACSSDGSPGIGAPKEPPRLETTGPEVLSDADGTGIDVSKRLFESSDAVVVASTSRDDQLHGAAVAAQLGAPLLVRALGSEAAIDAEIQRLGAERVIDVPGQDEALAQTAPVASDAAEGDVAAIAALEPANPVKLVLPDMLATPETSLGAAATARAAGANLDVLGVADPRLTSESMQTVTAQDTLALGRQWGTTEDYAHRVELAHNGELPGGGGLVFPGRRMIALYGHSFAPELGVMGEQDPVAAAALATQYAQQYQPMEEQPVIPAFEIIVTVASEFPGEDGDYSNEAPIETVTPWIDAITEAGGYAVLDLQPGQGDFLHQAKLYEELLKRPNVGLALDSEWKLNPGEQPLSRVGSASAEEINVVADWLAQLTRENNLPQKAFVLHQFQLAMFPDRENIQTAHPELAYVLHADGHGSPGQKYDTWNVLREGLDPNFFMAWKNFIDEDQPTFTPEQTYMEVEPRPWFVSYQ